MHRVLKDYLFGRGYFVAEPHEGDVPAAEDAAEALVALAHYAQIRITAHPELATIGMLDVAKRNIGFSVPEAFYRGFPNTVRELSPAVLAFDQFLHYFRTYGLGDFSEAGRSLFEQNYERAAFAEGVESKDFAIIENDAAEEMLLRMAEGFLASTRPLSDANYHVLMVYLDEHPDYMVEKCACKDTAIRLILDLGEPQLARFIEMPDIIRLVEWLLEINYHANGEKIRKINLNNYCRKLVTSVIDTLFERGRVDTAACLEKKRAWNGLLHHLHYRPKCPEAEDFCRAMRTKERKSVYSAMEARLAAGDVRGAADVLFEGKGPGAVIRHLDLLLSRIERDATLTEECAGASGEMTAHIASRIDEDVAYVLDRCATRNKIILVQLLIRYGTLRYAIGDSGKRVFAFVKYGRLYAHRETDEERRRRRTILPDEIVQRVVVWLSKQLESVCKGTLGKVYVDDALRNVALPLQEGASMGGFGTLPCGTHIPLPVGKKVRAFTYWEKVNDVDLSCIELNDGCMGLEYSWRTMDGMQSDAIAFSGDQTSGYSGGSEYFDIDLERFSQRRDADSKYLVFCNNVYSGCAFDKCICRAGYMLRDIDDSGEVFEPATVQTSFVVDCASSVAYLFAIDLHEPALIWLNLGEQSNRRVAAENDISYLVKYLHMVEAISLGDFAQMLAAEVVETPEEADVVFSDEPAEALGMHEGQELISTRDTARILELLN